tara:strand:- start:551 stop:733 length:183 start_codon:yes stop_codon:yes gene_type:complete
MKKSKKATVEKKTQEEHKEVEEEKPVVISQEEPQNNVGKMTKNPKKLACVEKWRKSKNLI